MEYVIFSKANNLYLGREENNSILRCGNYKTAEFIIQETNRKLEIDSFNLIDFGIEEFDITKKYDLFIIRDGKGKRSDTLIIDEYAGDEAHEMIKEYFKNNKGE